MYTLKIIARRGTLLSAAASLVVAAVLPAASVFAQSALNPLTERSLLLSSSAPGYIDTDGSGYSTANPNPAAAGSGGTIPDSYAPAGSGPNGMKTGETFSFNVSTTSTSGALKGMSLQYCTTAAGLCKAPGNNTGDFRGEFEGPDPDDWDMASDRQANTGSGGGHENGTSDLEVVDAFTKATSGADPVAGQFQIYVNGAATTVDDWTMNIRNIEDNAWQDISGDDTQTGLTGKDNYITLSSATGISTVAGQEVKIVFAASESVYITNPGAGAFFVKINTYNSANEAADYVDSIPADTNSNIIDGGVTVANVMTDSIHIVTKVLETMAFSVGIQNPDTVNRGESHGKCEPMSQTNTLTGLTNNRLNLGNPNAEYSLEVGRAYDVYSYWRLSSNSSGGATVYYSGNTLSNTSGDKIAPMDDTVTNPGQGELSNPGSEQFGLGFVDAGADVMSTDTFDTDWVTPRSYPFTTLASQTGAPYDTLAPQTGSDGYKEATGRINVGPGGPGVEPIEARFRFFDTSLTTPEVIAQQNETVISCATAKMRYVANIGADTPAGVYTTKINYLAAPQY